MSSSEDSYPELTAEDRDCLQGKAHYDDEPELVGVLDVCCLDTSAVKNQHESRYRVITERNCDNDYEYVSDDKDEAKDSDKTEPCLMGLAILCSDIISMFNHNCPHENHSYKHRPYKTLVNELSYKLYRTRHRFGVVLKFKFNEIV